MDSDEKMFLYGMLISVVLSSSIMLYYLLKLTGGLNVT